MGWYKKMMECLNTPQGVPYPPASAEVEKEDPRHGIPLDFFIEAPTIDAVIMRLKFELSPYSKDYDYSINQYKLSYFAVPVTQVGSKDKLEFFVKGDLNFEVIPEMLYDMNIQKISVCTPEYLQKYIDIEWGDMPMRNFFTHCSEGGSFSVEFKRLLVTYNI